MREALMEGAGRERKDSEGPHAQSEYPPSFFRLPCYYRSYARLLSGRGGRRPDGTFQFCKNMQFYQYLSWRYITCFLKDIWITVS